MPKAGDATKQGEKAAVDIEPLEPLAPDTMRRGVSPGCGADAGEADHLVEDDRSGTKPSDPPRKLAQ